MWLLCVGAWWFGIMGGGHRCWCWKRRGGSAENQHGYGSHCSYLLGSPDGRCCCGAAAREGKDDDGFHGGQLLQPAVIGEGWSGPGVTEGRRGQVHSTASSRARVARRVQFISRHSRSPAMSCSCPWACNAVHVVHPESPGSSSHRCDSHFPAHPRRQTRFAILFWSSWRWRNGWPW